MRNSRIEVQPISGALGAEIEGVDISRDLDDAIVAEIRRALLDHGVIFFRDADLDVERHKAFARRFGRIFVHPYLKLGADPEIIEIRREPGDTSVVGDEWHSDTTMSEAPPMGSILYGVDVPPYGGDTMFANQYLAYETLSDGMKRLIDGLEALHSDRLIASPAAQAADNAVRSTKVNENAAWKETINAHPVVRTHPETGRKCLYVNRLQTVGFEGMTVAESKPLLDYLIEHGNRPEFTCRFRWRKSSVAFWDNRCTKHYALNDTCGFRRVMRRIQLVGDRPF